MLQFTSPPSPGEQWRAFVAGAAVQLAREVGWPAELVEMDGDRVEIDCGGRRLTATGFGSPAGQSGVGNSGNDAFTAPAPPEVALQAFAAALGSPGGTATVLAPVGRYASHADFGMIDAVAISVGGTLSGWTVDIASVGHGRCWVILASLQPARAVEESGVEAALRQSPALAVPSSDYRFTDTARLCEAMRDEGWTSGLFPLPVVMTCAVGTAGIRAALAATEASTILAIAAEIGTRAGAPGTAMQHLPVLADAWKATEYRA